MNNEVYKDHPTDKELGKGVSFEKLRRITGYLVSTLDRWNSGKKAEEHDRVKHGTDDLIDKLKVE